LAALAKGPLNRHAIVRCLGHKTVSGAMKSDSASDKDSHTAPVPVKDPGRFLVERISGRGGAASLPRETAGATSPRVNGKTNSVESDECGNGSPLTDHPGSGQSALARG